MRMLHIRISAGLIAMRIMRTCSVKAGSDRAGITAAGTTVGRIAATVNRLAGTPGMRGRRAPASPAAAFSVLETSGKVNS